MSAVAAIGASSGLIWSSAAPNQAGTTPAGMTLAGTGQAGTGQAGTAGALPNASAIQTAQKALAKANSDVAQDKRNHSPSCVAFDQKQADKAQQKLSQAEAQAKSEGASAAQIQSGLSILA